MSWISELAGKAENLLNKIDQNAATALQIPNGEDENDSRSASSEIISTSATINGLRRNLSTSSLSKSLILSSPRKYYHNDESKLSESLIYSNKSSRQSSNSRIEYSTVVEPGFAIGNQESKNNENKLINMNVEKELAAFKIALADVTIERDEIKSEVILLQEELKNSLSENRVKELTYLVNSLTSERDELLSKINEITNSNFGYIKSISDLEAVIAQIRQDYLETFAKLQLQIKETEQHTIELEQYRKKAQSTLQMKDKIIEELKGSNRHMLKDSKDYIISLEIDNIKLENTNLLEETQNLTTQLQSLRDMLDKQKRDMDKQLFELKISEETAKTEFRNEQQKALKIEYELKFANQKLSAVREQLTTQQQLFATNLHEKENELVQLHRHIAQVPNTNDIKLKERIKLLTDSLVEKQTTVETITAERNALKLQMEKIEDELQDFLSQSTSSVNKANRNEIIQVNDCEDAKFNFPILLRENPFDNRVARRVKRAYSTLDSAGIRIGVFLRRYPLIRISVFIYVAFLHIWVMFVLLSSTPTV